MTRIILFLLLITLSVVFAANNVYNGIVIDDVQRSIDASKPNVVRQSITIKVVNSGEKSAEFFHLALPKEFGRNHLAYLKVTQGGNELKVTDFGYEDKQQSDAVFYQVQFASPLQVKQKVELSVSLILTNDITTAFPKEIEQSENQKLLYTDNAYFYSPYSVATQKTTIEVGTNIIDSYTNDVKPSERRGTTVVYGPFTNQRPFAYNKVRLHYQNNNPYVVISKVERHVEVSHWGNIAVEEQYDVRHGGAKFKGSFSRSDYARNPAQTAPAAFRQLTAKLPPTAADVYFRDRIGNISTSEVRSNSKNVEVDFLPRFPLFGGWRIRFTIGYNLPTPQFLSYSGDQFKLTTKFSVPFDFAPVDDLSLRIVLPEGSTNIKASVPFPVDSEQRDVLQTYLDIEGRPVVVLKKTKLAPEHNQDITITYTFASHSILREPGLIIGALFAFCLFMIAYVRFDLTIQKSESAVAEERELKIAELSEEFIEKQLQLNNLYSGLEQAIQRIRKDDSTIFDNELKKVNAVRSTVLAEVATISQQLNAVQGNDVASRIKTILTADANKIQIVQDLAKTKKDLLKTSETSSPQFAKAIKPLEQKYDTYSDEVTTLLDQLIE